MRIGCGLLAYNSERWIAESAGCLQEWVDKVIVGVDNITTDHTREILDEMRIEHFDFEWKHDYSYAKNLVIDKLNDCDWIIWLDHDEKLSFEGAFNLTLLIKSLFDISSKNNHIQGIKLPRKHHYPYWTVNENKYLKEFNPDFHIQAFRQGYKFEGKIHEGINIPSQQIMELTNVSIHHHAWQGNREKYEALKHNYYQSLTQGKKVEHI